MSEQTAESVIECVEREVHALLEQQGAGHGMDHILRVRECAMHLQSRLGGDAVVIELSALLHDVGDAKFHNGQERTGELSRQVLKRHGLPDSLVSHVIHIVENLSYRKRAVAEPLSMEGEIVQDSDRLDALGAAGIVRTIEYGQFKGQPFFDPLDPERPSGVTHFRDKLFRISAMMHTAPAREIAHQREAFMKQFLNQYFEEINVRPPDWFHDIEGVGVDSTSD
jgi:uncharacterized protein